MVITAPSSAPKESLSHSFIDPADEQVFMAPKRRFLRRLRPLTATAGALDSKPLERVATLDVGKLKQAGSGMRCKVISVSEGDGIAWSATMADRKLTGDFPEVDVVRLRADKRETDLPEITALMTERSLAILAHKYRITRKFSFLSFQATAGLIVAVLAIGLLSTLLAAQLKVLTSRPALALLLDPTVIALSVGAGLLALLGKWVRDCIALTTDGEDMQELGALLHHRSESTGYKKLVEEVARRLARMRAPRFVIAKRFDQVDDFSQDVIFRYFAQHAIAKKVGFEVWIIFETRGLDLFAKQKLASSGNDGYRNAELFAQEYLPIVDRRRLAERVGHPELADRDTVGAICGGGDDKKMRDFFTQHLEKNPPSQDRYGSLDFFYLLALNFSRASPPSINMSEAALELSYTGATGSKLQVLRTLLPGTRLDEDEIAGQFAALTTEFDRYVRVEAGLRSTSFLRISSEVGRWLESNAAGLHLKPPALVHIFWSLYWFDETRDHRTPYLTHKIAAHLDSSVAPKALAVSLPDRVTDELFFAARTILGECLRASLPEKVPSLVQRASSLIRSKPDEPASGRTEDVIALGWLAYALTGAETVLKTIADLSAQSPRTSRTSGPQPSSSGTSAALDPLEDVFVQSLGYSVAAGLLRVDESIRRYAQHRALWLALTAKPFIDFRTPILATAASMPIVDLVKRAEQEIRRLKSLAGHGKAVDYLSLSTLAWCLTLALGIDENNLATAEISSCLSVLESTLALVEELQKEDASLKRIGGGSVDLAVLAHELGLIVCSSAAILARRGADAAIDSVRLAKIMFTAELVAGLVTEERSESENAPEPTFTNPASQSLAVIEGRLELIQVVWATLGFSQFAEFATLRGAQLHLQAKPGQVTEADREAVTSLASVLHGRGLTGVMANLVIATANKQSLEIAVNHLCHSALAALNAGFAQPLLGELCLMALVRAHTYDLTLDSLLENVVRTSASGIKAPLENYLANLPDELLVGTANFLLNVSGKVDDISLSQGVRQHLAHRTESAKEPFAGEVRQLIDLVELQADIRAETAVDVDDVLEQWKGRRASQNYPLLLYRLFGVEGPPTDRLVAEAASTLAGQPGKGEWSSWPLLAMCATQSLKVPPDEVAVDSSRAAAVRAAVLFLKREFPAWAADLPIDVNIQILSLLIAYDPQHRADYLGQLKVWETRRRERDGMRKLPSLVRDGKFFLVLWNYFDTVGRLGLRTELSPPELQSQLSAPTQKRLAAIKSWRKGGERLPAALLDMPSGTCLSSQFLTIGHYIYSPPADDDQTLDDARRKFNEEAESALKRLTQQLVEMPSMPADLRAIILQHRAQFFSHGALPQGARA